jgi:hypothetical protein
MRTAPSTLQMFTGRQQLGETTGLMFSIYQVFGTTVLYLTGVTDIQVKDVL